MACPGTGVRHPPVRRAWASEPRPNIRKPTFPQFPLVGRADHRAPVSRDVAGGRPNPVCDLAAPTSPIVTFILLLLALNVMVLVWLSRKTRDPDGKALWLVRVGQVFSNLLLFISVLAHP